MKYRWKQNYSPLEVKIDTEKYNSLVVNKINVTWDFLFNGLTSELTTYKGVMISKSNPEKDMFKVNLLNMLQK